MNAKEVKQLIKIFKEKKDATIYYFDADFLRIDSLSAIDAKDRCLVKSLIKTHTESFRVPTAHLFFTLPKAEKYAIKFLNKEKKRLSTELKKVQSALTKLLPAQDVPLAEWFDYMENRAKRETTA